MKKFLVIFILIIIVLNLAAFVVTSNLYTNLFGSKVKSEYLYSPAFFNDNFTQTSVQIPITEKNYLQCYLYNKKIILPEPDPNDPNIKTATKTAIDPASGMLIEIVVPLAPDEIQINDNQAQPETPGPSNDNPVQLEAPEQGNSNDVDISTESSVTTETSIGNDTDTENDTGADAENDTNTNAENDANAENVEDVADSTEQSKGLIIIAPSSIGGQNRYMPHVNFFINAGYSVFTYDGKGFDESYGRSRDGVTQSIVDLESVLYYITQESELKGTPIFIYGDEMGAFASLSLVGEYQINAIVSASGFSHAEDFLIDYCMPYVGPLAYALYPSIKIKEFIGYTFKSLKSANKGIKNSSSKIFLTHGQFNPIVRDENYEYFIKQFPEAQDVYYKQFPESKIRLDYTQENLIAIRNELDKFKFETKDYRFAKDIPPELKTDMELRYQQVYSNIDLVYLGEVVDFFNSASTKNVNKVRLVKPLTPVKEAMLDKEGNPVLDADGAEVMLEKLPQINEQGNPVLDEEGKQVYTIKTPLLDEKGKLVLDDEGNQVYIEDESAVQDDTTEGAANSEEPSPDESVVS